MGKTSLASEFPSPVFIQTEVGQAAGMELDSFGHLVTFGQVLDALGALATEDHKFLTVVIDSLSEMEKMVWTEVCGRNKWPSIETPGYGKGYVEADYAWAEFIEACNYLRSERNMAIVMIAHSTINTFNDPETQSYNRYDIDLHKRGEAIIKREVDGILLLKKDVTVKTESGKGSTRARGDGGDTRYIYTQGRPAYAAGNRYNMPDRLIYKHGEGFKILQPYFPDWAQSSSKKAA